MRARILQAGTLAAAGLQRDWTKRLLMEYAQWLARTRAGHTASFTYLSDLMAPTLLTQFPVAHLRRYLLPTSFLHERLGLVLTAEAKVEQAEARRITDLLVACQHEVWAPLITGYRDWLTTQEVTRRTMRLLLRSAERFCKSQRLSPDAAWGPTAIPRFLARFPGYRAGLFKFVTYVRSTRQWEVEMPKLAAQKAVPRTVTTLADALQRITSHGVDQVPVSQLTRALAKALGFTVKAFAQDRWQLQEESGSVMLIRGDERIEVPAALVPVARAWMRRRT
jgi:hypothetical protein